MGGGGEKSDERRAPRVRQRDRDSPVGRRGEPYPDVTSLPSPGPCTRGKSGALAGSERRGA